MTERSEAETQKRVLASAEWTRVICSLITFGFLVWAGIFPEIYGDPNIPKQGDHRRPSAFGGCAEG